jgi:hypothetical protein
MVAEKEDFPAFPMRCIPAKKALDRRSWRPETLPESPMVKQRQSP